MALGTSQGFLNSPKTKYLGGDSVSGKAVHVWHFFQKNLFSQNDLPDLDSLVQIKNRDTSRVRTVVTPNEQNGTHPPGAFGDVYSFWRLCWGILESLTRTRDILF